MIRVTGLATTPACRLSGCGPGRRPLSRDPAHRAFLDDEFERFGTRLVALDDWDDDTHEEGELLEHLKGWVSKAERASQYPSGAAGGGGR